MTTPSTPQHTYDVQQDARYQKFENGSGSLTDEVAYQVLGKMAFNSVIASFSASPFLRVCDVGSFLGGSSARWLTIGQSQTANRTRVQVLGTDIHKDNVQSAAEKYQHLADLQFRAMSVGGEIPRIEENPYHLIFAAFVLDTIPSFEDVSVLCQHMAYALEPQGEIYLLRLHPNAVKSSAVFREYQIEPLPAWQHGDPLRIQITSQDGQAIKIKDTYWEPSRIAEVLASVGSEPTLLDVSLHESSALRGRLASQIASINLALEMPEWHIPLYQIMRAKKK